LRRYINSGLYIADIVSDEPVPQHLKDEPHLWSGCISGAVQEHEFVQAFIAAGFAAVRFDKWGAQPWQMMVEGIEFRSVTNTAVKPHDEPCVDKQHAVIFSKAYDDECHIFVRGQRTAVCERSYHLLTGAAYDNRFIGIAPVQEKTPKKLVPCAGTLRAASETKGSAHKADSGSCCC
jgi:hypothetical protein